MIPKIESASNEREKQRFSAFTGAGGKVTLPDAENEKENDFLQVFRGVYTNSQREVNKKWN